MAILMLVVVLACAPVAADDSQLPPVIPTVTAPPAAQTGGLTLAAGQPLPSFAAVAHDYTILTRDDLASQPTLLVFFASWCPHCQAEAPRIVAAAAAHPEVRVVMLSVGDRETPQMVFDFQSRFGLPFPTYWDGGRAAQAVGVQSYPTIIVADKTGTVQSVMQGEIPVEQLNGLLTQVTS